MQKGDGVGWSTLTFPLIAYSSFVRSVCFIEPMWTPLAILRYIFNHNCRRNSDTSHQNRKTEWNKRFEPSWMARPAIDISTSDIAHCTTIDWKNAKSPTSNGILCILFHFIHEWERLVEHRLLLFGVAVHSHTKRRRWNRLSHNTTSIRLSMPQPSRNTILSVSQESTYR